MFVDIGLHNIGYIELLKRYMSVEWGGIRLLFFWTFGEGGWVKPIKA
jgi:hypothetical protein